MLRSRGWQEYQPKADKEEEEEDDDDVQIVHEDVDLRDREAAIAMEFKAEPVE